MKQLFILICIFSLSLGSLRSQTPGQYQKDLSALYTLLKKTPSYKDQMRDTGLKQYHTLYEDLQKDTINLTPYHYFTNLAKLMMPIRDGHLGLAQVPDFTNFKDRESIEKYVTTQEFKDFPVHSVNIDSLKAVLKEKPADSIEGIYYYDWYYTVGVFKIASDEYLGIIVDKHEDMHLWEKGQIAIHLYEYKPGYFKAIYAHPLFKNFILYNNERFEYQSLINSHFYLSYSETTYQKKPPVFDYTQLPRDLPMFQLKNLNEGTQYLLIKNFSANSFTIKKSIAFYDSIRNNLKASSLIIDLRNNEGGADKVAGKFMNLIKKYAAKNKVYVLVNSATISQGEIFALELRKQKNVKILGRTTKGVVSYGSNYGNWEKLSGKQFEVYLTDMKDTRKLLLRYENVGMKPDVELNNDNDWIQQALQIIKKEW